MMELWAFALVSLKLPEERFWSLSLRQLSFILNAYKQHKRSEDRGPALIACLIANANRDPKKKTKPYTIEDFMPGSTSNETAPDANAAKRLVAYNLRKGLAVPEEVLKKVYGSS